MNFKNKKILITGGRGFLGNAVSVKFRKELPDDCEILSIDSKTADLRNFREAEKVIQGNDIVVHLAADCGGIGYNRKYPGQLFYNNMAMGMNVLEASRRSGVKKLLLTGSVCGYPKYTKVPFREESLWDGYPEETNAPYGLAKRELLTMAQAYRKQYGTNAIYLMVVNLYGEQDHFWNDEKSHVIPALIKKFAEAKKNSESHVTLWGSGKPTREFLHVEDAAEAVFLAMKFYDKPAPINVGAGFEISISDLAEKIRELVGYDGCIEWDSNKPDGQPRRCLDVGKAEEAFHFKAKVSIDDGLKKTISWYLTTDGEKQV